MNTVDLRLWEILVPCVMNGHPTRTKHHKNWDAWVRKLTGGLTILKPARGQWIQPGCGTLHEERVIPVRIAATDGQMDDIIDFTIQHYNQLAVMAYVVSERVIIRHRKPSCPVHQNQTCGCK